MKILPDVIIKVKNKPHGKQNFHWEHQMGFKEISKMWIKKHVPMVLVNRNFEQTNSKIHLDIKNWFPILVINATAFLHQVFS